MTGRTIRVAVAMIAAVVVSLCAAACISSPTSVNSGNPDAIKIGTLRGQPHLFAPYVMRDHAADGATYEIVLFDNSPDIKNAVVSGAVDYAALGVPSVLAGVAAGEDVRLIASEANGGYGFVGKPSITTPSDLRGTKIGYPAGATQEILLRLLLAKNGIADNDVQLVNLPFSDMANAYKSGQIDAFLGAEVGPSTALHAGAHNLISPYDTPIGGVNIGFATRASTIQNNPQQVQTVVNSLKKATEYMLAHPDEWADGLVNEFGVDGAVVRTAIKNVQARWQLDPTYREQVTQLANQMVAFDQISRAPDMSKVFDTTFVDAAQGDNQ